MKNKYVVAVTQWWLAVVYLMSLALSAQAQSTTPPVIQWQRVIEPSSGLPIKIIKASNGGYALTTSGQVIRLSESGNTIWQTNFQGSSALPDSPSNQKAEAIVALPDGGFGVLLEGVYQWSLARLDAAGTVLWIKPFVRVANRGGADETIKVTGLIRSNEGGFIIIGNTQLNRNGTYTDLYKFDADGNSTNTVRLGGSSNEARSNSVGNQIIQIADGNYLVVGSVFNSAQQRSLGWGVKLNSQLQTIWQNQYDYVSSFTDISPIPYGNDGYIAVGISIEGSAVSTLTINPDGTIDNGSGSYYPRGVTSAMPLIVSSESGSHEIFDEANQNSGDFRLVSYTPSKNERWSKTLGGSSVEKATGIITTSDGGYLIVGTTSSNDGDVKGKSTDAPATWIVKLTKSAPVTALTLLAPLYNCQMGTITLRIAGGDDSRITYNAPGVIRSSITKNRGVVEQGLRNDPKPITITATQSGQTVSYTFDFKEYCDPSSLPIVITPIPNYTVAVGVEAYEPIDQYFSRDPLDRVVFTANGLPPGLYLYEPLNIKKNVFGGVPTATGVYNVTVSAINTSHDPTNNSTSTTFRITVVDGSVVNPPPVPPTANALTVVQPIYDCQTGAITFTYIGGDGSPITYSAPGISRSSATSNSGIVEQGLRNDPKPITITATQSGQTSSYTFDFNAFCGGTQPPVLLRPIPDFTFTVSTGVSDQFVSQYFSTRTSADDVRFTATGLPLGLSFYDLRSLREAYFGGFPRATGVYTVTVTATNITLAAPNNSVSTTFKITIVDQPVVTPPSGNALTLLAPGYDCATGAITFRTSGGDNSMIEYAAAGITGWTTNPNQFVDRDSRTASDVKPFTLMARQNGVVVTYVWDLKAACGRARIGVGEGVSALRVSVLGNPVSDAVTVEVRGVEGQPLLLRLVDVKGHVVESQSIEQAGGVERQRFELSGSGPALLLLRASSGSQSQTVKILKQ